MELYQFNNTPFKNGTLVIYKDEIHLVGSVDFEEQLIQIFKKGESDDAFWVRCENVDFA